MMTKKTIAQYPHKKKFIFMLLSLCVSFAWISSANAHSDEPPEEIQPIEQAEEKPVLFKNDAVLEPVQSEKNTIPEVTEADLQKAREKIENALKEKGEHSIEMTEARLELARLELKNLVAKDDLQRFGALVSLKRDKVKVLENLLQRKIAAERSRAEAEKARIAAELLKIQLEQEIKELSQEQKELAEVRKEESQALEEEAQAKIQLQEVVRQLNQKIKEVNRKIH